jgi:hypothetical protein
MDQKTIGSKKMPLPCARQRDVATVRHHRDIQAWLPRLIPRVARP